MLNLYVRRAASRHWINTRYITVRLSSTTSSEVYHFYYVFSCVFMPRGIRMLSIRATLVMEMEKSPRCWLWLQFRQLGRRPWGFYHFRLHENIKYCSVYMFFLCICNSKYWTSLISSLWILTFWHSRAVFVVGPYDDARTYRPLPYLVGLIPVKNTEINFR